MSLQGWPEPPPAQRPCTLPARLEVEVAILGAGIHGAALARELTLRGVSCALVDKGGVGGGTSQWSTKLFHGGIRYLLTGDLAQMRHGLRERATWVRIAPHRCRWEAIWMPSRGPLERFSHRLGIGLYDLLGADRPLWPAGLALGRVPTAAFRADPRAQGSPFEGAVAYADCLTWDRDVVRDLAASSAALLLDFHEVQGWEDAAGALTAASLRDRRDGSCRRLAARQWVSALGPWTDEAMALWFQETTARLRLSAGIHLWLDPLPGCVRPWAMRRPGGRILFVIPRDGLLQVGTTEREVAAGWVPMVAAEREELYGALEANLPGLPWRTLPVRREELGVRPLLRAAGNTALLSREAQVAPHPRWTNLHLVLGGKLTTARQLMDAFATRLTGKACPASVQEPLAAWDQPR